MGYYKDGKYVSKAAQRRERLRDERAGVRDIKTVTKKMDISKKRSEAGKIGAATRAKQFAGQREAKLIEEMKRQHRAEMLKKASDFKLDMLLDSARKPQPWDDDYVPKKDGEDDE